jgi:hypothetical protein
MSQSQFTAFSFQRVTLPVESSLSALNFLIVSLYQVRNPIFKRTLVSPCGGARSRVGIVQSISNFLFVGLDIPAVIRGRLSAEPQIYLQVFFSLLVTLHLLGQVKLSVFVHETQKIIFLTFPYVALKISVLGRILGSFAMLSQLFPHDFSVPLSADSTLASAEQRIGLLIVFPSYLRVVFNVNSIFLNLRPWTAAPWDFFTWLKRPDINLLNWFQLPLVLLIH